MFCVCICLKPSIGRSFFSASEVLAAGGEPALGMEFSGPGLAVCSQAVGYRWLEEGPTASSDCLRAPVELYTGAYECCTWAVCSPGQVGALSGAPDVWGLGPERWAPRSPWKGRTAAAIPAIPCRCRGSIFRTPGRGWRDRGAIQRSPRRFRGHPPQSRVGGSPPCDITPGRATSPACRDAPGFVLLLVQRLRKPVSGKG